MIWQPSWIFHFTHVIYYLYLTFILDNIFYVSLPHHYPCITSICCNYLLVIFCNTCMYMSFSHIESIHVEVQRTLLGDSCTDDKCDTFDPCGLSSANWLTSGSISNSTIGTSSDTGNSTTPRSTTSVDTGELWGLSSANRFVSMSMSSGTTDATSDNGEPDRAAQELSRVKFCQIKTRCRRPGPRWRWVQLGRDQVWWCGLGHHCCPGHNQSASL